MGNSILLKLIVGVCAALAVFGLSSCSPSHRAVGDTQDTEAAIPHDADPGAPLTVAVIGCTETGPDQLIVDALTRADMKPYYSAATEGDDGAASRQAVIDAAQRRVKLIMISDLSLNDGNRAAWTHTLEEVRADGVPVILVNPVDVPEQEQLYAAAVRINDRMLDAIPIASFAKQVILDEPHEREATVSTVS